MTPERTGRLCVGLLSGTSADGIDAALVRISGAAESAGIELLAFVTLPYPPEVRRALFTLFEQGERSVEMLCSLNFVLGGLFAEAAIEVCRRARTPLSEIFVVGSHGQTVWHQPAPDPSRPLSTHSTLQIGEPAVIAERTGATVIADFRVADIAAGGQGAPLTPYFDWVVLRDPARARAVQNIGGIGNVTYLPAGAGRDQIVAFDTGPGNMLIDGVVTLLSGGRQVIDTDGALAASGTVDQGLLAELLSDPYLQAPPPKTTGRERYGLPFCRELLAGAELSTGVLVDPGSSGSVRARASSLVATVTAFTARSIADAYRRFLPLPAVDEVIVGGGGSRNPTLLRMIAEELAPIPVATHERYGIDGDAKEAMLFALLAHDGLLGLPTNIPAATGARRAVTLGKRTPPGGTAASIG